MFDAESYDRVFGAIVIPPDGVAIETLSADERPPPRFPAFAGETYAAEPQRATASAEGTGAAEYEA